MNPLAFVGWLLDAPLPRVMQKQARLLIAFYIVLATALATEAAFNRWAEKTIYAVAATRPHLEDEETALAGREGNQQIATESQSTHNDGYLPQYIEPKVLIAYWKNNAPIQFFAVLIIVFIHLTYWLLFAGEVFAKRNEDIKSGTLLVPTSLIFAYIIAAFTDRHLAAILTFIAIYSVLFLDELSKLKSEDRHKLSGESTRALVWVLVDGFLVVGLVLAVLDAQFMHADGSHPLIDRTYATTVGIKDGIIALNIIGYLLAMLLSRHNSLREESILYRFILERIKTSEKSITRMENPPWLPDPSKVKCAKILDFACSSGDRTIPLLKWMKLDFDKIEIIPFDTDASWRKRYEGNCGSHKVKVGPLLSRLDDAIGIANEVDYVLFSYVFQERSIMQDVEKIIKTVKPGTFLVVSGFAPSHFLNGPVYQSAIQGLYPKQYYNWELSILDDLVAGNSFEIVLSDGKIVDIINKPKKQNRGWIDQSIIVSTGFLLIWLFNRWIGWPIQVAVCVWSVNLILFLVRAARTYRQNYPIDSEEDRPVFLPAGVINRRMEIDNEVVNIFADWIEIKYGSNIARSRWKRLQRFIEVGGEGTAYDQVGGEEDAVVAKPSSVSYNDVIYIFRKK